MRVTVSGSSLRATQTHRHTSALTAQNVLAPPQ
jgi:hypothetical protein